MEKQILQKMRFLNIEQDKGSKLKKCSCFTGAQQIYQQLLYQTTQFPQMLSEAETTVLKKFGAKHSNLVANVPRGQAPTGIE